MKMINESAAQRLIFPRSEGRGNGASVSAIFHGVQSIDARREETPGVFGGDLEIRNKKREMQLAGDGEHLALETSDNVEATIGRRPGVVGMAFQVRTRFKNFVALQRTIRQFVQSVQDAKAHGYAAAEATRLRDIACDRTGKRKRPTPGLLEKCLGRRTNHSRHRPPTSARNGDVIVKTERDAQAIETWSKIGSACRDADGDLLHD